MESSPGLPASTKGDFFASCREHFCPDIVRLTSATPDVVDATLAALLGKLA